MASAPAARLRLARELMDGFAVATGLEGAAPPRRYLWTDAFAVCNFLGLHRLLGEARYLDLALRLVDQVHHVLGRHRPDDARRGWISGLSDDEGERRPTLGGLRIGKPLPERREGEAFDPELEWERDGQYLHYLTQWMHALRRASAETGQPAFHRWAVELARTAHAAFTVAAARGPERMVWKKSVDLRRTLVPSMGQHDALDAWLADVELQAGAPDPAEPPGLGREIVEARALCAGARWETDDALGVGALLVAALRCARLVAQGAMADDGTLARILAAAAAGLAVYARGDSLARAAGARLAFRELGLAIGLHAVETMTIEPHSRDAAELVARLMRFSTLAVQIDGFWSDPDHRAVAAWTAHADINAVMLATSLAPDGYLGAGERLGRSSP